MGEVHSLGFNKIFDSLAYSKLRQLLLQAGLVLDLVLDAGAQDKLLRLVENFSRSSISRLPLLAFLLLLIRQTWVSLLLPPLFL